MLTRGGHGAGKTGRHSPLEKGLQTTEAGTWDTRWGCSWWAGVLTGRHTTLLPPLQVTRPCSYNRKSHFDFEEEDVDKLEIR